MQPADLSGLTKKDYAALRDMLTGPVAKLAAARRAIQSVDSVLADINRAIMSGKEVTCIEAAMRARAMLMDVLFALADRADDS